MMICPVPSSIQTAVFRCHILWTTKIWLLESICFVCVKNKYIMITLSDLADIPSEGNSEGEILGFQVIYFQVRNFVYWQYCRKVRLTLQRNQTRISVFYF